MIKNSPLLLIIDDEAIILETLKDALEDEGYRVEILVDGKKALDLIGRLVPDLVCLDIFMPGVNGLDLLEKIKKEYPQQRVMIISGFGNIPVALDAMRKGAMDFIEKPLNLDDILNKIEFLKSENKEKKMGYVSANGGMDDELLDYGIVGQSNLFLELIRQVGHLAKLHFPILIYGQHGTGKSLIADYIHKVSNYSFGDFCLFDCAAEKDVEKKLDCAFHGTGTLFFKNIHALSLVYQKKLLTYLEKTYDNKRLRIIASSSKSLFGLMQKDKFNSLLFHKLNITPIEIPPLDKRRYDIPLLIDCFLKQSNAKYKKSVLFANSSVRTLRNRNWVGNVRELKLLVEKIVFLMPKDEPVVMQQFLQKHLCEKDLSIVQEQSFTQFSSLQEAIEAFEKKFLLYHLKKNSYDLSQVSDRLCLNIPQLRDKILKLGIAVKP